MLYKAFKKYRKTQDRRKTEEIIPAEKMIVAAAEKKRQVIFSHLRLANTKIVYIQMSSSTSTVKLIATIKSHTFVCKNNLIIGDSSSSRSL